MNKINDGGPAFPITQDAVDFQCKGMSLRQYYAGQIIGYLASNLNWMLAIEGNKVETVCANAFELADAMIKQGEK